VQFNTENPHPIQYPPQFQCMPVMYYPIYQPIPIPSYPMNFPYPYGGFGIGNGLNNIHPEVYERHTRTNYKNTAYKKYQKPIYKSRGTITKNYIISKELTESNDTPNISQIKEREIIIENIKPKYRANYEINTIKTKSIIQDDDENKMTDENKAINKQDSASIITPTKVKVFSESKVDTERSEKGERPIITNEREVNLLEAIKATESKQLSPINRPQYNIEKSDAKNVRTTDKPTEANSISNSNDTINEDLVDKPQKEIQKAVLLNFDTNINKGEIMSLADAFRKQKRSFIERLERKHSAKSTESKVKTKEERLEYRKEIMKPKTCRDQKKEVIEVKTEKKESVKGPKAELIERLASGKRMSVSKDAMKKRTERNYQQLPEVRRKREEEKKRQENLERIHKARLNEKVIFSFKNNRRE